jgi:hypothetical protein
MGKSDNAFEVPKNFSISDAVANLAAEIAAEVSTVVATLANTLRGASWARLAVQPPMANCRARERR